MRIGVNALYLLPGGVGGTEIYLRHLLGALGELDAANEYVVFTNRETGTDLAPARPNFRTSVQPVRASLRPARIVWEQTALAVAAAHERLDVLFNPGFTAPLAAACPQVTVFHDLQHKRHPEYFRWFDLPAWRVLLWAAAHRSRLLIAVSEATRADLLHYYRIPKPKVRTVPHGVDPRFFELAREPRDYILCTSTTHPHKNLVPLIAAFAELRTRRALDLVITGVRGFASEAVESAVREMGVSAHVRITGWVPREQLYELFRGAWAFAYPSTFEGFGMPVLEAMAAGIPTACSDIEPLRSIAADAALRFGPHALPEALERIVCDTALRQRLAAAGPARAREFSWTRTAELTLAALVDAG